MDADRTCRHCHQFLPWAARSDAQYCSTRCRVAAHRAKVPQIPADLRDRERWVRHDRKRPVTITGKPASSTDPATWASYKDVKQSSTGDGLGFVLSGDGIVCIDLDHCIEDGRVASWAADILEKAKDTYIEVSPSGTGLHIWGMADVSRGRVLRQGSSQVEIYGSGRYITVTGSRFGQSPSQLGDLSSLISRIMHP